MVFTASVYSAALLGTLIRTVLRSVLITHFRAESIGVASAPSY